MEKKEIFEMIKEVHELIYKIKVSEGDVIRMAHAMSKTQFLLEKISKDEDIQINYQGEIND